MTGVLLGQAGYKKTSTQIDVRDATSCVNENGAATLAQGLGNLALDSDLGYYSAKTLYEGRYVVRSSSLAGIGF
ncbi:hypothetical protein PoB_001901100 [Plakobranchus ocellatus]|uniref:Uncharacterized protein n=1 Tax=Plakobranchus ocellatus TaxID=259542 RepID=A0AAV3Z9A8_9GAST|nr:hypothetical protein PoB_001901100 [Plakobranchus ocellatus]